MTTERFVNQASTALSSSVGAGDLTFSVQSTTHFPTQPEFRIRIGQELMLVTGVSGTSWTVTRGIEGTTAVSHAPGSTVVAVLTGGGLDEMRTEIEAENKTLNYVAIDGSVDDMPAFTAKLASAASTGYRVQLNAGNTIQFKTPPDGSGTYAPPNSTPNLSSGEYMTCAPGTNLRFDMTYRFGLYGRANLSPGSTVASPPATRAANNNIIIVNPWGITPAVGYVIWVEQYMGVTPQVSGCTYTIKELGVSTIGITDVTATTLYGGGGTLNGLTLKLNIDGAGEQTLTLSGAGNTTTLITLIAAIVVKWPSLLQVGTGGASGNNLLISSKSIVIGAGTANTALGLTAGVPTYVAVLLDRSIVWEHSIGDSVTSAPDYPKDILLDFTGANVSGYANQLIEFTQAQRATVNGLNYQLTNDQIPFLGGTATLAFDVASRECTLSNSTIEFPNNPYYIGSNGFYGQSNEGTLLWNNRIRNARAQGYSFMDCYACNAIGNITSDCVWGQVAQVFVDGTFGCLDCAFVACADIGSEVGQWLWGSKRTKTLGLSSTKNPQYGLLVDRNNETATFTNCSYTKAPIGIYIDATATGTSFTQLNTDECLTGIVISGAATISQWHHHSTRTDPGATGVFVSGVGTNIIRDIDLKMKSGIAVDVGTTGTLLLDGGRIETGPTGYCLRVQTAARIRLSNITFAGGVGISCSSGTIEIGPNCDFSAITENQQFLVIAPGLVTFQQTGGVLSYAGSNRFILLSECYNTTIEISASASASGVGLPGIPGLQFTVVNNNTNPMFVISRAAGDTGVTIAGGKTAIVRVDSTNHCKRVTADL